MEATAKQKKREFARGAAILGAAQSRWPDATISRPKLNVFSVSLKNVYAGSFNWRLLPNGTGVIKWTPSSEFIDIAPPRSDFRYNYIDDVSDVEEMYAWASPIFDDILA